MAVAGALNGAKMGFGIIENPGHGIILALGNGIELVIVTTGACNRQAQHGSGQGFNLFIHHVHSKLHPAAFIV